MNNPKDNKGKLVDYLIRDRFRIDPMTGVRMLEQDKFEVWADSGLKEKFEKIEGIHWIICEEKESWYIIAIDPRYEIEYIKREVEAVIVCSKDI